MALSLLVAAVIAVLPYAAATLTVGCGITVDLVYQYNHPVWVENLAVRADGRILPATATSAVLNEIDPATGKLRMVLDESKRGNAIMSIAEVVPDLFVFNTMDCDLSTLTCTPGSGITWKIDLRHAQYSDTAHARGLVRGPDRRSLLNGMAALNAHTMLMVDQALGGIWAIDVDRGGARLLFTDAAMTDPSGNGGGVNGIRVRPGVLYFNNPSRGTFCRVPIDPRSGDRAGKVEVIAEGLEPDDFEVDEGMGVAYLTNGPANQLLRVDLRTGRHEVVVDGLLGPTTARWRPGGEESRELFVATTGGYEQWLSGNATVGGAVYRVKV